MVKRGRTGRIRRLMFVIGVIAMLFGIFWSDLAGMGVVRSFRPMIYLTLDLIFAIGILAFASLEDK